MNSLTPDSDRLAVVIIHGIGEQEPMATLRTFAESIIPAPEHNEFGVKEKFYVKPDSLSELFDLRRITIPRDKDKTRMKTDFYEYYWAHQIRDTKLNDVLSWIASIFLGYKNVPPRLRGLHTTLLLVILLIPIAIILLLIFVPFVKTYWAAFLAAGAGSVYMILKVIRYFISSVSINFIGDAARYFTAKPGNIINRQRIRQEGIALLRKLHGEQVGDKPAGHPYKRIVIVSHSLGSVIAYDLMTILWSSYHNKFDKFSEEQQIKLREMQEKVKELNNIQDEQLKSEQLAAFQQLQSDLMDASVAAGNPWRITDFITLGSPLAHAQLLMAKGKEGLAAMKKERLFPTCPPSLEAQQVISYNEIFNFEGDPKRKLKVLHHAAPFAFTRWTNLWFKNDFVGGPMPQSFGKGIEDIELRSKTHDKLPFLSHTCYWDPGESESIEKIRDIIFRQ
ncbi:MAG: hypothetical protein ABIQ31_11620 [Ferruginibacter sp.]